MAFTNGAQRQDETHRSCRGRRLIGMGHDAGVEEGRCLVTIFLTEIGTDKQRARIVGRLIVSPGELQVGVVLGVLGAPAFILLVRYRNLAEL